MVTKKIVEYGPIRAFLGDGTEFEGLLSFEGTVRIDGKFKGEIQTNDCLIVGETAWVEAEIKVGHLIVMGKLKGNVVAAKKVEIASSGRVRGDILSPVLMVQEGAIMEGQIHMEKDQKVVNIQEIQQEAAGKKAAG